MKLSDDRDSSMFTCWPTTTHSARRSHYRCHYHSLLCVLKWEGWGGGSLSSHFKARYSVVSCLLSSNSCWPGHRVGASILRRCTTPPPPNPVTTTPRNRSCYYPEKRIILLIVKNVTGLVWASSKVQSLWEEIGVVTIHVHTKSDG